jgi:hypothetical protein
LHFWPGSHIGKPYRATERATQTRRFAAGKSFLRETAGNPPLVAGFPDKERDLKFIGNSRVVDGAGQVSPAACCPFFVFKSQKPKTRITTKEEEAIGS